MNLAITNEPPRSKRQRDVVKHAKNARPREYWAEVINAKWQEQVTTIIETGLRLEEANAELSTKEWKKLLEDDLNITKGTASKLITICRCENVREVSYRKLLPPLWPTLYLLTFLNDDTFAAAVLDGRIHPKMQQKDALALRPPKPRKPKTPKPKPQRAIGPIDRCAMTVRTTVFGAVDELDADQWDALIAELRGELDDIERIIAARRQEEKAA